MPESIVGVTVDGDVEGSTTLPLRHKSEDLVHSKLPFYNLWSNTLLWLHNTVHIIMSLYFVLG